MNWAHGHPEECVVHSFSGSKQQNSGSGRVNCLPLWGQQLLDRIWGQILHRTVGLLGGERRRHRLDSVFRDLSPDVVVASVSGCLLMPWKMSNGRSRKPVEFPSIAMLENSLESHGRDTDFTGQGCAESQLPEDTLPGTVLDVPIHSLSHLKEVGPWVTTVERGFHSVSLNPGACPGLC